MKRQKVKGYGNVNKQTSFKDAFSVVGLCALCVLFVGITVFVSGIKNNETGNTPEIPVESQEDNDIQEVYVANSTPINDEDIIEVTDEEVVEEEVINEDEIYETESVVMADVKEFALISPLSGEILKKHSDVDLQYSKTLDDWRIHTGVDIKAKIGTTVSVCEDGVVEYAGKDVRYGHTIIVSHTDGFKTVYSNLTGTEMVKIGKDLKKGDPIGMVGDSAVIETSDEAHLHFEVLLNEKSVDPMKYIKI